jgi:hypothetical protein
MGHREDNNNNDDDDDGLALLQRARLLVQAASNLPDFSTLFSKKTANLDPTGTPRGKDHPVEVVAPDDDDDDEDDKDEDQCGSRTKDKGRSRYVCAGIHISVYR